MKKESLAKFGCAALLWLKKGLSRVFWLVEEMKMETDEKLSDHREKNAENLSGKVEKRRLQFQD